MGGGNSSSGYDSEYNRRMAELAERSMGMEEKSFDVWDTGGGRELEIARNEAGMDMLPLQSEYEKAGINSALNLLPLQEEAQKKTFELGNANADYGIAQTGYGMKKLGHQSALMDDFYSKLGKHNEGSAMAEASADVASAVSKSRSNVLRDAQRRGVSAPNGGSGLDAAKLEVGARYRAMEDTRAKNLNELSMGMQI